MRKIFLRLIVIALFIPVSIINAQEIVKKKKTKDGVTETFFVLKENKDIRYGPVLKSHKDVFGKVYLAEIGQYENNLKTGKWYSFYSHDPSNFLKSIGYFHENKKNGQWRYYHQGRNSNGNLGVLLGDEKRTDVADANAKQPYFNFTIDSTGQKIMAVGQYVDDVKTGVWVYYTSSGRPFHTFNHSANELVTAHLIEEGMRSIFYLGGTERFYNHYFTHLYESDVPGEVNKTSEAIFDFENGKYKYISAYGDERYKNLVEEILNTIPQEWIFTDKATTKKVRVTSKVTYSPDSFKRYTYDMKVALVD